MAHKDKFGTEYKIGQTVLYIYMDGKTAVGVVSKVNPKTFTFLRRKSDGDVFNATGRILRNGIVLDDICATLDSLGAYRFLETFRNVINKDGDCKHAMKRHKALLALEKM